MSDLVLKSYGSGTSGTVGVFTFKAEFDSGPAIVQIILIRKGRKTLVNGLHINPANAIPGKPRKHET